MLTGPPPKNPRNSGHPPTHSSYELLVRLYVGIGQTEAARVAGASHPLLAERITDNLSMLCAGERHRQSDEGQGAVQREETRSVLRAGQDANRLDPQGDAMVGG